MLNRVIPDGKKEVLWDEAGNYRSHPAGVAHFFLVYLAVLVGFTFAFLAVTVSRLAGWNDSLAEQLVGEPFWLPNILAGACFGAFFYKRIRHRFAFWSWVPSCILLIWSAWDWHGAMSKYDSTWDTYFGKNCGGSECVYQIFLTVPFYASVAYALGAVLARVSEKKKCIDYGSQLLK